jgi:hypothetical protein
MLSGSATRPKAGFRFDAKGRGRLFQLTLKGAKFDGWEGAHEPF